MIAKKYFSDLTDSEKVYRLVHDPSISMALLARQAKVTRPGLYRYRELENLEKAQLKPIKTLAKISDDKYIGKVNSRKLKVQREAVKEWLLENIKDKKIALKICNYILSDRLRTADLFQIINDEKEV